jgi:hypothetical protein
VDKLLGLDAADNLDPRLRDDLRMLPELSLHGIVDKLQGPGATTADAAEAAQEAARVLKHAGDLPSPRTRDHFKEVIEVAARTIAERMTGPTSNENRLERAGDLRQLLESEAADHLSPRVQDDIRRSYAELGRRIADDMRAPGATPEARLEAAEALGTFLESNAELDPHTRVQLHTFFDDLARRFAEQGEQEAASQVLTEYDDWIRPATATSVREVLRGTP